MAILGYAALTFVALVIGWMMIESRWLEISEDELSFEALPPAFDGFRILLVSDFHAYWYGPWERHVVRRIKDIDADLLVIAGDLKAHNTTPNRRVAPLLEALLEATRDLPETPVYVRGNHDRRGFDGIVYARDDIQGLRDASVRIERDGQSITIAGVRRTARVARRMRPSFRKALRGVSQEEFTILVAHSPDFFRMAARRGVDLVLSGDTHGGQIRIPRFGPVTSKSRLGRRFNSGAAKGWGGTLFVSRGAGTMGPPFRLACRPEVAVLTLRRAASGEDAAEDSQT